MMDPSLVREFAMVTTVRRLKIHAPRIYELVRKFVPDASECKDTPEYVQSVYEKFAFYGMRTEMNTLELGPGSNLGVSVAFAQAGNQAFALDIEDLRTSWSVSGDSGRRPENDVAFVLGMAENVPLRAGSFDLIFSNACLEHVRDVERVARENWRVLRASGRAVHQIDMRDHRHFNAPLTYLQYNDFFWQIMNPITATGYQNRWRLSQYIKAYEDCGFKVTIDRKQTADEGLCIPTDKLAPKYRGWDREDLRTVGCLLVAEKPA